MNNTSVIEGSTTAAPVAVDGAVIFFFHLKVICDVLSTFVSIIICFTHTKRFYSDFFTVERKSVSHRRTPPDKSRLYYRRVSWLTVALVIIGIWNTVSQVVVYFNKGAPRQNKQSFTACGFNGVSGWWSYFGVKLLIYYIFTFRLQLVYSGSSYEIPKWVLRGLIIFSTLWILAECLMVMIWSLTETDNEVDSTLDSFDTVYYPNGGYFADSIQLSACFQITPWWFLWIFVIGFDVAINFIYYTLFIVPVRRLARAVTPDAGSSVPENERKERSKVVTKMLVVGIKVGILSTVLVFSTIITWVIFVLYLTPLLSVDGVINIICLIFMTPYYPDKIYFHKFCAPCIFCCDRKGYTQDKYNDEIDGNGKNSDGKEKELVTNHLEPTATTAVNSNESIASSTTGNQSSVAKSIDTMSQPRVTAHEQTQPPQKIQHVSSVSQNSPRTGENDEQGFEMDGVNIDNKDTNHVD